jgi:aarF domain-containing kinase
MAKSKAKSPPQGFLSRSATLFGMAARVAAKEVATRVFEKSAETKLGARLSQAKEVVDALGKLKGAAMKAGQILSIEGRDFFPPEVIQILSKLQDQGESIEFDTIQKILKKELGDEKLKQLKNLSLDPVASASIGQVHSAEIEMQGKKQKVAVKVQFPGVASAIDSDIAVLSKLARSMMTITGKRVDLTDLMKEVKSVLKAEVDYIREAQNLRRYRDYLKGEDFYVVPAVYPEFSTKRVLTLEWMDGMRFQDWIDSKPPLKQREQIAVSILNLYFKEFFEWGFVQTDPNLANFLVQTDPLKLVVLDFGATISYSKEFRRDYRRVLQGLQSGDPETIFKEAVEFGLLDPRESDDVKAVYKEMMEVSFEPFRPELQPFQFSDVDYSKRTRDVVTRFTRAVKYSAPPKKIIFLHRKLGGVFNILKALDVRIDLVPYWQRMIESK